MGQSPILEKITPRQAPLATHGHTLNPSNISAIITTSLNTYEVGRGMISELNSMDQCGYWDTRFYISVFYMGLDILVL